MRVRVDTAGSIAALELVAGRRGSLVISEFFVGWLLVPPLGSYFYGGFVEIYNNGDSTVYLDGKHLIRAYDYVNDSPFEPCDVNIPFRLDSLGVWAYVIYRFPGSGRSHSVSPGEAVVVATDAVDHRPLAPRGLDLRNADYELLGSSDVDNPAVPNLSLVGLVEPIRGHGILWFPNAVPLLADTFDLAALPHARTSYFNTELARIPPEKILDVAAFGYDPSTRPTGFSYCSSIINPRFDRAHAEMMRFDDDMSAHRRVLSQPSGAPPILQRTRTSARDFYRARPTPGTVP